MVVIKRRVIQVANSTQLISLPKKWADRYSVRKGDELEIQEQGNKIIVSTEKGVTLEGVEIDVTGLDRSSIWYYIRSAYRMGYDEIRVTFNDPTALHFRTNERKIVISVIHQEVNRLVGMEIVQQKDNFCLIKDLHQSPATEFDNVLRRLFLLSSDATRDLTDAIEKNDELLLQTLEEKHDTITKFASYCLRLLNKRGYSETRKIPYLYHIIAGLDKITYMLKSSARFYLEFRPRIEKEDIALLHTIRKSIIMYVDFFYKFDKAAVVELYRNREMVINGMKKLSLKNKSASERILLVSDLEHILEVLVDLTEARMGLQN